MPPTSFESIVSSFLQATGQLLNVLATLINGFLLLIQLVIYLIQTLLSVLECLCLLISILAPKCWRDIFVAATLAASCHVLFRPNYREWYQGIKNSRIINWCKKIIGHIMINQEMEPDTFTPSPTPSPNRNFRDRRNSVRRSERSRFDYSDEATACVVCKDSDKCILLLPCKHVCLCKECWRILVDESRTSCPVCRDDVIDHLDIYL